MDKMGQRRKSIQIPDGRRLGPGLRRRHHFGPSLDWPMPPCSATITALFEPRHPARRCGAPRSEDRSHCKEIRLNLAHHWRFLTGYLRAPNTVGALAPSSRALAEVLCTPFRRCVGPARVLEVIRQRSARKFNSRLMSPMTRTRSAESIHACDSFIRTK